MEVEHKPPTFTHMRLESGRQLVRFNELHDLFYFDDERVNPNGLGQRGRGNNHYENMIKKYYRERTILTPMKIQIIEKAQKDLAHDPEFLELVYKAKSDKRKTEKNKFCGNLSVVEYAKQSDKMFTKGVPGAKKSTIDMAFQVGTFCGGNYTQSFVAIVKTILMAQAMGINMNIDMFDSDTQAIGNAGSYVISNVAKSSEKLDMKKILTCSHEEFFWHSLFNGYSASGNAKRIGTFLSERTIVADLGAMYDIIAGNMLEVNLNDLDHSNGISMSQEMENPQMVSKILKIAWKR